jgi:alkylhydroperoxidase family enzyme
VVAALNNDGLRALAPEPFAAWDTVLASIDGAVSPELVALVRAEVAAALGVAPVSGDRTDRRECRELIAQFVVDVGSVADDQRAAAFGALGDDAFAFAQVLYVCDVGTRLEAAWRQLFGTDAVSLPSVPGPDLWSALEEFMRAVARMDALDPLTSELVRLRGARSHRCRVCQSRRSARAAAEGADESVYDQIDDFESSALAERHKTALRLVDAMLWQPRAYPTQLIAELDACFSPDEIVEIVLDVARNAANKIAVAFAADAPNVSEGVELYDIDARGEVVFESRSRPS